MFVPEQFPRGEQQREPSGWSSGLLLPSSHLPAAHQIAFMDTLYRKSSLCIPRNENTWPRSRFLHSCFFERFAAK
jgi:hypothetical protein